MTQGEPMREEVFRKELLNRAARVLRVAEATFRDVMTAPVEVLPEMELQLRELEGGSNGSALR